MFSATNYDFREYMMPLNGFKIHIGIIYRTPDSDVRIFCDHLMNILEKLKLRNQPCYLMGDYHIDLLKHATHNPTSEFLDLGGVSKTLMSS